MFEARETDQDVRPAHNVVRRPQSQPLERTAAPFTRDLIPPQEYPGTTFVVQSEVLWPSVTSDGTLKGPPQLRLQWKFRKGHGGRILAFRRRDGFGKEGDFGELIVKSRSDGEKIEQLDPGDYFYSFFRVRSLCGLLRSYGDPIEFTQTMPSPAKVLEVMRQAIEFTKLQKEFQTLNTPAPPPEDPVTRFEREFSQAMATVDQRFIAAKELQKRLEARRKEIEEGDYSDNDKRLMLKQLNGMMRMFREQFEL